MSAGDKVYQEQEVAGHIFALICDAIAVTLLVLLIIHCYCVYHDLHTKERKSVSHRRTMPKITAEYKWITYLTTASVFFFAASAFSASAQPWSRADDQCGRAGASTVICIQCGKTAMYMVFLLRLHTIFAQSAYSYPKKCITCFGIVLLVWGLGVIFFMIFVYAGALYTYGHHKYPNWCGPGSSELFPISVAMVVLEDLASAIGFLIAFLIPLKKTLKAIGSADNDPKVTRKIVYAGTKTTVLTTVAMFSTLGFLFLVAAYMGIFAIFDILINPICMMLMTAYYPDKKYYRKLCFCCIACCDKGTRTSAEEEQIDEIQKSENEPTRTEIVSSTAGTNATETRLSTAPSTGPSVGPSVDTMSQLRVAGADTKVTDKADDD